MVYDITLNNQTGTSGEIRIYSDIASAGDDVYIYANAGSNVHIQRNIPFKWNFYGSSGIKQHVYVKSFPGAGVKTYIGTILQ